MFEDRRRKFEQKIEPLMVQDNLPEPVIRFSKELYSRTGIEEKTLAILKILQCKVIVRDNPEEVKAIEDLDNMARDILKWKTFAFSQEIKDKTSKEIEELSSAVFGSYNKFRVANAMSNIDRNPEVTELLKDVDKETLETLMDISLEVAEDLRKERDIKMLSKRE